MFNIFSKVKDNVAQLQALIAEIKNETEKKSAYLEKLRTGPITRDEAKTKAIAGIRESADRFPSLLNGGYGRALQDPQSKLGQMDVFGALSGGFVDAQKITKESLHFLFQDQIEKRLCDAIDAMPWPDTNGLPPLSERPKLIEKTLKELDRLFQDHNEMVEQAEKAGIYVDRVFKDEKERKKYLMKQHRNAEREFEESGAYLGGKRIV